MSGYRQLESQIIGNLDREIKEKQEQKNVHVRKSAKPCTPITRVARY